MTSYEDTTIEDVLKTFEDFYVKKDYQNALLTLQKQGGDLPEGLLNYNLGTVYTKMGNWAEARYHFLEAREAGFSAEELNVNQNYVESKLEVSRLESPLNTMDYFIKGSIVAKDGILTGIGLVILLVGIISLKKSGSLLKGLTWALCVLLPLGFSYWIGQWPKFIVSEQQLISEGPSSIFNSTNEVPRGILVIAKGSGSWREIIYPSRFQGWVKVSGLKRVE